MRKSRFAWLAIVAFVLVAAIVGGCAAKKKRTCYPCTSPSGQKTTCWGGDFVLTDHPGVVDLQQTLVYDETLVAAAAPAAADITPTDGDTFITYQTPQLETFGSGMDFDSPVSVSLTAEMNDGRQWYAYTPTLPQSIYDQWKSGLQATDSASEFNIVLRAYWGPLGTGCDRFDSYDVDLYLRESAAANLLHYDTVPTSWGWTLRDLVALPILQAPDSAFDMLPETRKAQLTAYLDYAVQSAEWGQFRAAIDELAGKVRPRLDGSDGGDPANDWITDPFHQGLILPDLDAFIAYLDAAATECE